MALAFYKRKFRVKYRIGSKAKSLYKWSHCRWNQMILHLANCTLLHGSELAAMISPVARFNGFILL